MEMALSSRRDEMEDSRFGQRMEFLRRLPLFEGLSTDKLAQIAMLCNEVSLEKGETVCRKGEEGDRLFIVTSGEIEVWGGPDDARLLSRLGPGEFVGELGILTGGKRNATVVVARTARLIVITKAVFDQFLHDNRAVQAHLSVVLARRLAKMARGENATLGNLTAVVTGPQTLRGKSLVAALVAALLRRLSRSAVILVSLKMQPGPVAGARSELPGLSDLATASHLRIQSHIVDNGPLGSRLTLSAGSSGDELTADQLSRLIANLSERFVMIVFDLGDGLGSRSRVVESVCDYVIEMVNTSSPGLSESAGPSGGRFEVLNLHNPECAPIPINHCQPFVIPDDPTLHGLELSAQVERVLEDRWSQASVVLRRLVRKMLGGSVGIALGGGAAFGISHVGVLEVLEEGGVPIDLVAGTSMGSIVGLGYAAGLRPTEMVDIARRIGTRRNAVLAMLDLTLSKPAIFSGAKMARLFSGLAGQAETFEQLVLPCRSVAVDVETGERVSIGAGRVDTAYRASSAVPVVWAPLKLDGRVLIDGSMIDPVPADVVREMGADLCIAVNVVPPLKKGVQTGLSRWFHRAKRLNPFVYLDRNQDMPSMFDVLMNTIQMVQRELGNYKAIPADVSIDPDLTEFTWSEIYRAEELIERGRAAAEQALPVVRRLLAERLEARRSPVVRT